MRIVWLVVVALMLTGCVSTTDSVLNSKANLDEALQTRVELARRYIGKGDWANAERNLKLALSMDDRSAEIYEAFALLYQGTGEEKRVRKNFQKALSLDPEFSRARNNYAVYLYSLGDYEAAAEQLNIVLEDTLYPQRPQAFVNLGLVYLQLNNPDKAALAFERALVMQRTNPVALMELAQICFDQGDIEQAQSHYGAYRLIVKQQSARSLWLGIRLAKLVDDKNAQASYALALRNLFPKSAEYKAYQEMRAKTTQ